MQSVNSSIREGRSATEGSYASNSNNTLVTIHRIFTGFN